MRFRSFFSLFLAMVLVSGAACGPSGDGNGGGGGGGNVGDDPDASGDPTTSVDAAPIPDGTIGPDANCGVQEEDIELINLGDPPDMLIVLDRSASMILPLEFPPMGSKWDVMKGALKSLTTSKGQNIRFGLSVFPNADVCGVEPGAEVNIALNNAGPIASWLDSVIIPDGSTPAHLGLQNALGIYQSIPVNPEGRYVLFATDGLPNCGGNPPSDDVSTEAETLAAVQALSANGIKTFVLGFGSILGLDPQILNDAAQAGGVPRPGGPPYFYHADNAQALDQALDAIAGGIIAPSCEYALAELPPDPDLVTVTVDGVAVPRDASHQNGWDYHPDASTITFFGNYCQQVQSGAIGNVAFSYGCPGPVVN